MSKMTNLIEQQDALLAELLRIDILIEAQEKNRSLWLAPKGYGSNLTITAESRLGSAIYVVLIKHKTWLHDDIEKVQTTLAAIETLLGDTQ